MEYVGSGIIAIFKTKYDGKEIKDYYNDHTNMSRDSIINKLFPPTITACSIMRGNSTTCIRPATLEKMVKRLGYQSDCNIEEMMRVLMRHTKCNDEKCILNAAKKLSILSLEEAGIEEQIAFKQSGPTDISLFNDTVIQAQMYAWMYHFHDFWAYNFNMLNYNEKSLRNGRIINQPDTLATINWMDLYEGQIPDPVGLKMTPAAQLMIQAKKKNGVRRSGCIINSDTYDGNGKHWMALFVDVSKSDGPWTIEFFNSAAIRPESEWLEWMANVRINLQKCAAKISSTQKINIEPLCVCNIWHQHSKTECGPYSLFYIWARLNGIPAQYFMNHVVPDQMMFEFRHHLFNNDKIGQTFDFSQFSKNIRIHWDTEVINENKKRTNI